EALAVSRESATLRVLRHDGSTPHLCSVLDHALRSPHPPTAFLVARATASLTVLMHLLRRGHRIPHDFAVIEHEDDPSLPGASPSLATYADNPEHFARRLSRAVRQLAETGSLPPRPVRLMPRFIPGESVWPEFRCPLGRFCVRLSQLLPRPEEFEVHLRSGD